MVVGHYATALVAKKHVPDAPLWLFLIASILLDWTAGDFCGCRH